MSQTKNIFRFFTSFLSPVKVEERNGAVVIDLAKKYFHIDRYKNLSLHIEDAGDLLRTAI